MGISTFPATVVIRDLDSNTTANVNTVGRLETQNIAQAHAKVHAGDFYTVSYIFAGVAAAASVEIFLITGSTYSLHSAFGVTVGGDSYFYIFEGTTVSANGTALTAYNNLRSSASTTESSWYYTPTTTADGTQLYIDYIPGGSGVFAGGGSGGGPLRAGTELDFKPSTNYLLRVTNTSTGAIDIAISIGYYEN